MVKVPCKLVTWDDVVNWCKALADKIRESGWIPDVVVAIARGGFVPARLICDYLGIVDLLSVKVEHWIEAATMSPQARIKYEYTIDLTGKKVLIVDDIADTGDSIILTKEFIEKNWKPAEIKVATMQWISSVCKIKPDYYVDEVKEWIWYQYPWTRLEDTTQFIKRFLKEMKDKKVWTYDEIVNTFKEWYGIDVGEWFYKRALEELVKKGVLRKVDDKYEVISV